MAMQKSCNLIGTSLHTTPPPNASHQIPPPPPPPQLQLNRHRTSLHMTSVYSRGPRLLPRPGRRRKESLVPIAHPCANYSKKSGVLQTTVRLFALLPWRWPRVQGCIDMTSPHTLDTHYESISTVPYHKVAGDHLWQF